MHTYQSDKMIICKEQKVETEHLINAGKGLIKEGSFEGWRTYVNTRLHNEEDCNGIYATLRTMKALKEGKTHQEAINILVDALGGLPKEEFILAIEICYVDVFHERGKELKDFYEKAQERGNARKEFYEKTQKSRNTLKESYGNTQLLRGRRSVNN